MTRECLYVSHFCQKKTRAKTNLSTLIEGRLSGGAGKAKKKGRNSRFGVPTDRKGRPKMSQQKAKEEQPVKEGEKNDESTATAKYQQIR